MYMSLFAENRNNIPYMGKAAEVFFTMSFIVLTTAGKSFRAKSNLKKELITVTETKSAGYT